jgi:hypothetical protein
MGMGRQDVKDEIIFLRAAGVDLGKRFMVACVRVPRCDQGRLVVPGDRAVRHHDE